MSNRCQQSGPHGQCTHNRVDGSEFCKKHSNEEDRLSSYRLADPDLQKRFAHHSNSDSLRTVKEEVSLMRILLEERINFAKSEAEKICAFPAVQVAASNLSRMVETLSKLERQTDTVLSKDSLMSLNDNIINILIEELSELDEAEDIIGRVASRIGGLISSAHNKE